MPVKPFFSIVIPLYNKEKDVAKTIQSVLDQEFHDFEVIIVNDGSTDNGPNLVKGIKDSRLELYSIKNRGVSYARNFGVEKSKADYIAFLDADDYWYPHHLKNFYNLILKYPLVKWFASAYEIQYNKQTVIAIDAPQMAHGDNWVGEVNDFFSDSMRDCLAWTSAVGMCKDFFIELNGFNRSFETGQDVDLWIRAALKSNIIFSTNISAKYNHLGSNRITHIPTLGKVHMDLNKYKEIEQNNASLKKYIDLIRYAFSIKFKLAGEHEKSEYYKTEINLSNLTSKQRFLLLLNKTTITFLKWIQYQLITRGLRVLTSGKNS